jgi:thiamine biosynthesis lipoprotein
MPRGPWVAAAALGLAAVAVRAENAPPVRLAGTAFGQTVEVDVRGLAPNVGPDVGRKALERIAAIERLTDASAAPPSGLAQLNLAAGKPPLHVDPDLFALLQRAASFCEWSSGIHGPLGGELGDIWGLHGPIQSMPIPSDIQSAIDSAACTHLVLDAKMQAAGLAAGSRADLGGFAPGFAVDRAVELLRNAGAPTGWVRIGSIARGFGPGPSGGGWSFELAPVPGARGSERVLLRDRAIAVLRFDDRKLGIGGEHWSPYLDQRHGRPGGEGVLLAAASTDLAVDAQAVAVTMFAAGTRVGQSLLGGLRPAPAVLWLLGLGNGAPLRTETRWSQIRER